MIRSPLKYTTKPYILIAIPLYSSLFDSTNTFDVERFLQCLLFETYFLRYEGIPIPNSHCFCLDVACANVI